MTFEELWQDAPIGARVRVSNGMPEPAGGFARALWRSHNHEGEFVDKLSGPPRSVRITLDKVGGARVSYDVSESVEHSFEVL